MSGLAVWAVAGFCSGLVLNAAVFVTCRKREKRRRREEILREFAPPAPWRER